ncbi:NAD(P)-binding protein [Lentithecium fluviatile CBS 122367]|uniref:NAD(P)-binding protein n=1 Tax=Lentithecium fluviatile CBS 122367 TaxID=1168545 RepID=A0A6G1J2H7_9PLEO|nr:NAD(P)-binding protein [Lentithecium fluviatile CBS 122367]
MTYPPTYRAWRRTTGPYPHSITLSTEVLPGFLDPHDVVIRIHAVALNYRDVAMLHEGCYPVPVEDGGVSASDCAAEVVAIGAEVKDFVVGDRVAPTVDLARLTGEDRDQVSIATGGDGPGLLREYAMFEDKLLVKLPKHLSWEEASTITCAGVTAWVALDSLRGLTEGATAMMQGTGGVSMFALLICLAAGIRPIITSSSDAKLAKIKQFDPRIQGINYKQHPDVAAEALRLTEGKGVDYIVNNIGLASVPSDLRALRKLGGIVALVGFLDGWKAGWSGDEIATVLFKAARIQGILGGSKADFVALNAFLDQKKVKLNSLIDKTFSIQNAPAAFDYLWSGKHVGKVVIKF